MRKALLITLLVLLGAVNAAAGPADPPTLPALPEPGQVVGISRFSVADIQELPTPGNPPTGYLRLYADSGTEQLKCLTSAGASCLSSGGGSSAFSSLTSGTNTTATMVVGSGASLGVSGTGTIAATSCGGTTTQILFNDGGVCASSASLAFNKTLATLGVGVGFSDGTLSSDIGFTSSANSPISLLAGTHITDTVNSSNHFPAGGGLACEYTGSATLSNSSCNGFYAQGLMNGTGTMAQVTGMNAFGYNQAGTLTGGPVGAEITAENDATALNAIGIINGASNFGTITGKLEGIETGAEIDGGTVATMIGLEIQNIKSAGTVTGSNTGLLIDDLHGISAVANYGIHIVNLGTASIDWAIKVDGGKSEFGGPIILDGLTSGSATLGVADVAGTPNRINLPTATGSSGNCLKTDGANPQQTSWGTCSTTTGTVTSVATTGPITGGTITSTGTIDCATCGVTGSPLSQFASTTSSQLAGVISDETGSGALVFATSPTLVTPVIGAATGTSLSVSGQLTSTVATGTAPLAVSSTTNVANLNASTLSGATFAAPGAIGGTTPAAGTFTSLACGVAGTTSCVITGAGSTSGTATITWPAVSGTTTNSIVFSNAVQANGLNSGGSVTAGASSALILSGRSAIRSAADGRIALNNNANGSLGLTRVTFGTEASTNPAFAPLSTILDVVDGAGTSTLGATTVLSANGNKVFVTTNFTTAANTSLQTITGLTFNFPAVAHNWNFSCHIGYSQATGTAAVAFGIQAATNNPTNIFATGELFTAAGTVTTGTLATLATTTATNIVSGTPGATATNNVVDLYGTLELAASANAVNIMVSTATSADAVTVLRGSSCQLF